MTLRRYEVTDVEWAIIKPLSSSLRRYNREDFGRF